MSEIEFNFNYKVLQFELFTQVESSCCPFSPDNDPLYTYVHSVLLNTTRTIRFQNDVNMF
jgi:hypothetical protein